MNVATGDKDGESLKQDYFTTDEIEFARKNGVTLERRISSTVGGKYLANVCTGCDQIQGNWFLYMDPFHDRFNLQKVERQEYGPCDQCATRYCMTHGEYMGYRGGNQCPHAWKRRKESCARTTRTENASIPKDAKRTAATSLTGNNKGETS